MLALDGFTSFVSFRVDEEARWVSEMTRTIGQIFFGDYCVAEFISSPDIETNNGQFKSMLEWPRINKGIVKEWTTEQWREFFLGCIRFNTEGILKVEKKCISELKEKVSKIESVLRYMGKLPEEDVSKKSPLHDVILEELATSITIYRRFALAYSEAAIKETPIIETCLRFLEHGKIPGDKMSEVITIINSLMDNITKDPSEIRRKLIKTIEVLEAK